MFCDTYMVLWPDLREFCWNSSFPLFSDWCDLCRMCKQRSANCRKTWPGKPMHRRSASQSISTRHRETSRAWNGLDTSWNCWNCISQSFVRSEVWREIWKSKRLETAWYLTGAKDAKQVTWISLGTSWHIDSLWFTTWSGQSHDLMQKLTTCEGFGWFWHVLAWRLSSTLQPLRHLKLQRATEGKLRKMDLQQLGCEEWNVHRLRRVIHVRRESRGRSESLQLLNKWDLMGSDGIRWAWEAEDLG